MNQSQIKIISHPQGKAQNPDLQLKTHDTQPVSDKDPGNEFLNSLACSGHGQELLQNRLITCLHEISVLRNENRWKDIVELFHPLEENVPELIESGLDYKLRLEIAFAQSQLGEFDQAISSYEKCLQSFPEDFQVHNGLAFTLYNSLFAAKNKEILLTPEAKKQRLDKAHKHFQKAQELRPHRVTNYYRQGMLYKNIQNKPEFALPLFTRAVDNWRGYTEEEKEKYHQERKNYIKALYNLAWCQSRQSQHQSALKHIQECVEQDQEKNHIKPEHKYFACAKTYFHLGELEKSRQLLELALSFTIPAEGDYICELQARIFLHQKNPENGLSVLQKIPRKKKKPYIQWTEADLLLSLGKIEQARQLLLACSQRDKRSKHKSLIRLCKIEFSQAEFERALDLAKQSDQFHRETYLTPDKDSLFWQAGCLFKLNRIEQARETIRELEERSPDYPYLPKLKKFLEKSEYGSEQNR